MFWERFTLLCAEKGTKPNPVAKELGFASSTVTAWKNGSTISSDKLQIIADYFGVSTDYLLGKTEKRQAPEGLTAKDMETLEKIKFLQENSPEDYALVKNLIEKLANK